MPILRISLDHVRPNPWQTRNGDPDPEYIRELADDIAANGLLQVPAGRIVGAGGDLHEMPGGGDIDQARLDRLIENGFYVQLAFGHNRLAAYRHNIIKRGAGWGRFPVDVRPLNDEKLADYAWSENERRREITAYERALAIEKRLMDFNLTHEQLAESLQISRSVISNALRLLKLPEEVLSHLRDGDLAERSAIALLGLFDLPEELRAKAERSYSWEGTTKPAEIVRSAIAGESSDRTRERIGELIDRHGNDLKRAGFDVKQKFVVQEAIISETCAACERMHVAGKRKICMDQACFLAKRDRHKKDYLARAEAASGIKARGPEDGESDGTHGSFVYDAEYVPQIREAGCERLRLLYEESSDGYGRKATLADVGFPNAVVACKSPKQFCNCLAGAKALAEKKSQDAAEARRQEKIDQSKPLTEVFGGDEPDEPQREEAPAPTEPTAEELQELAKKAREERRARKAQFEEIRSAFANLVDDCLRANNPGAWRYILDQVGGDAEGDLKSVAEYQADVAQRLSNKDFYYDSPSTKVEDVLAMFNRRLRINGLPQLFLEGDRVESHDPAGDVLRNLERIEKYARHLHSGQISMPEVLDGNLEVLKELEARIVEMDADKADHSYYYRQSADPRLTGVSERIQKIKMQIQAICDVCICGHAFEVHGVGEACQVCTCEVYESVEEPAQT